MSTLPVAVIVPTCNRAETLSRALESVLAQTRKPAEIIVIDDGSTDDTARLCAREFADVTYVYQSNAGVSAARNEGLRRAGSEWLALLDSDDEWLPDKLEQQFLALAAQPRLRVCHTDEVWIRDGVRVNPKNRHAKHGGWIFQHCLPLCAISPSAVVVHRTVFEQVGVFDETLPVCEDYDLWLRVCARFPVLYVDRQLVVKYGGHADQLSRRHWGMDRFRIAALRKIIATDALRGVDRAAASATLKDKIRVYLQGAAKRQKAGEVEYYQRLLDSLPDGDDPSAHRAAV